MSIEAMTTVWKHSKQEGTALLLLLAIADHANDAGEAWPSVTALSAKIRRGERATQYLLTKLTKSGELEVTRKKRPMATGRGIQMVNLYLLKVMQPTAPPAEVVQSSVEGGAVSRQGGAIAVAPEPSVEPSVVQPSITTPSLTLPRERTRAKDVTLQTAKDLERREALEIFEAIAGAQGWARTPHRQVREVPLVLELLHAGFPKDVIIAEGRAFKDLGSIRGLHYRLNAHSVERIRKDIEREASTKRLSERFWPEVNRG